MFLVLWGGGETFHFGGGLIHILLIFALIALVYQLFVGNRNTGPRGPLL